MRDVSCAPVSVASGTGCGDAALQHFSIGIAALREKTLQVVIHTINHYTRRVMTERPLSQRHLRRIAVTASLCLSLLVAQFGALTHAYSHLHPAGADVDQIAAQSSACAACLQYAPLLSPAGANSAMFAPVGAHPSFRHATPVVSLIARSVSNAFRSRAPPVLH